MKPFNVGKDGTIFVNVAKGLGKAAKQTRNPPAAITLAVLGGIAGIFAIGFTWGKKGRK